MKTPNDLLHLVLTRHWYDETVSGRKRIEYRTMIRTDEETGAVLGPSRWIKEILERREHIKRVRFARAYTKTTAVFAVTHIDVGPCPIPGWDGEYIRIHFTDFPSEKPQIMNTENTPNAAQLTATPPLAGDQITVRLRAIADELMEHGEQKDVWHAEVLRQAADAIEKPSADLAALHALIAEKDEALNACRRKITENPGTWGDRVYEEIDDIAEKALARTPADAGAELERLRKIAAEGRKAGREEAVRIILDRWDAEEGPRDLTDSAPCGDTGDYSTHWLEDELRAFFDAQPGAMTSRLDELEALYWDHAGKGLDNDELRAQLKDALATAERHARDANNTRTGNKHLRAQLASAEAERDAYKKAKAENDERFMIERDEARHRAEAAEARVRELADIRNRDLDAVKLLGENWAKDQARLAVVLVALEEIDREGSGALNNAFPEDAPEVVSNLTAIASRALIAASTGDAAHPDSVKLAAVIRGLTAVEALIGDSFGVAGLHLNGDVAPWAELRSGGRYEGWLVDFDAALDAAKSGAGVDVAALLEDKERLDWLCDYITSNGLNGMKRLTWTILDDEGESLMHREKVSEEEVGDMRFDRAAIDAARKEGSK